MDPLQQGPMIERPEIDDDSAELAWPAVGGKTGAPSVTINVPQPPAWWMTNRTPAWPAPATSGAPGAALPAPPAWPAPAVAELGRILGRLVQSDGPEKFPPLPRGVNTYSPFRGG